MASLRIAKLTRNASASDCWAASRAGGAGLSVGRETSDMGCCLGKTNRFQRIRVPEVEMPAVGVSEVRTSEVRAWQRVAQAATAPDPC